MNSKPFGKDDYEDSRYPKNGDQSPAGMIPISRIFEKAEAYVNEKDYDSALRALFYWRDEAIASNDDRGRLAVYGGLLEIYRRTKDRDPAMEICSEALRLTENNPAISEDQKASAFLQIATVYQAFAFPELAYPIFENARNILENNITSPAKLAGLYNNLAITLTNLSRFDDAYNYYAKALFKNRAVENSELECAITYVNMANLAEARYGLVAGAALIDECLEKAEKLLFLPDVAHNSYYASVCEKCAPVFDYYGHFYTKERLEEIASNIFENIANP